MTRPSITATPPGALDLSGPAVVRRRALQRATMDVLARAGFEELSPPTFEYEEVFRRAGGAEVAEKLIRFVDLDGRILALGHGYRHGIQLLDAASGEEITEFLGGNNISAIIFSPDGWRIVTGSLDGRIRVWMVPGGH